MLLKPLEYPIIPSFFLKRELIDDPGCLSLLTDLDSVVRLGVWDGPLLDIDLTHDLL